MATAKVPFASDLKRRTWMREGLLQAAHKSFWSPMTGNSKDSVVYQAKNEMAEGGHTVVFDYDGNISGKATKGRETVFGKGEQKRKFSNKLTVERYRSSVDNGDKFDGRDIGDLSITEHSNSRMKLSDWYMRFKDQSLFDTAQGLMGQSPTHIIDLGTSFGYNELLEIERIIKTSKGFSTGGVRRPLDPYTMSQGPCWLFVMDSDMAAIIRKSPNYQSLVFNADVRGDGNRAIKGKFGKIGSLLLLEAEQFFGSTESEIRLDTSEVEISGLRQRDGNNLWTGQEGFDYNGQLNSRGLIMGTGALQIAFGKQPDYKYQPSIDFGITSESAIEVWLNMQKTVLTAENSDYKAAKVADIDYGVIAVDIQVQS